MTTTKQVQSSHPDLRDRPRCSGILLAAAGELLERAGLWLQENAAELQWRRLRALRRWGQ